MLKKRKFYIVILVIAALCFVFASCAPADDGNDDSVIYSDKAYSLNYSDGIINYKLSLDGKSNCKIFKYANNSIPAITATFTKQTTRLTFSNSIDTSMNEIKGESVYIFPNRVLRLCSEFTTRPAEILNTTDIIPGATYTMASTQVIDNVDYHYNYTVIFLTEETCSIAKTLTVEEYEYAVGTYEISNDKYVCLSMNISQDLPPVETGTQLPAMGTYVQSNGLIKLTADGQATSGLQYIQLYDNGTFESEGITLSSYDDENILYSDLDCYNRTFTRTYYEFENGDKYKYESKIEFGLSGTYTYTVTSCVLEQNYRLKSATEIEHINFNMKDYASLIGTHWISGQTKDIAIANTFIIKVSYKGEVYTYNEGEYVFKNNGKNIVIVLDKTNAWIEVTFYKDGTWNITNELILSQK